MYFLCGILDFWVVVWVYIGVNFWLGLLIEFFCDFNREFRRIIVVIFELFCFVGL